MKKFSGLVFFIFLATFAVPPAAICFVNPNAVSGADYLVALPAQRKKNAPVLIVLPGKKVPASAEENNWKFSATKNGFVLITLDVDYDAIRESSDVGALHDRIFKIIRELQRQKINLDRSRVYLAGTSMGGMMALSLSLRYPRDFEATSVVCGARFRFGAEEFAWAAKGRRFYLAHGEQDPVVPIKDFNETTDKLIANGGIVSFDTYPDQGHILSGAYRKAVDALLAK